ncbi:hypothetical protein [Pseudoflavonifractor sp. 60]|uniref:hypothetical protein n=1 Tax=Pseudoflavonifractor sp. 60 TaxID=2304576 RepID=UPI001368C2B3|nr:hypothetical protein [Pseudoflavonifractor sp. 60]
MKRIYQETFFSLKGTPVKEKYFKIYFKGKYFLWSVSKEKSLVRPFGFTGDFEISIRV